jgi:S-adenosylmethionine decarboxylase proenzyme
MQKMEKKQDFSGSTVGKHVIADAVGIKNPKRIDSLEVMQKILHDAAKKAKLTVIGENWEKFQPQGLSGFLFLSESHISIHYSPEHAFMWIDAFTCSGGDGAEVAMKYVCKKIGADMKKTKIMYMDRTIKF